MINNIALLSQNVLFKDFIAFWWKLRLEVRKSSKLGPHLGRILLKRSLFSHCEAFDFQVRIARLRKHWCRHSTNFSNCGSACKHCTCWQPRCHNEFLLVGSINALHIKFQGWTFIATFSTAYQQGWIYVQKNLKLSLLKSGYSETVCPDQPENLQNCLSIFFKTVQNVQKHNSIFSSNVEEYHQLALLFQYKRDSGVCAGWFIKMRKAFSTYFPHLFGPKLSITSQHFWNCLLGFETVCPEKDKQTAFYSPLHIKVQIETPFYWSAISHHNSWGNMNVLAGFLASG